MRLCGSLSIILAFALGTLALTYVALFLARRHHNATFDPIILSAIHDQLGTPAFLIISSSLGFLAHDV